MKEQDWKKKKLALKQKKFNKYKYLKEVKQIEVPEVPEAMKNLYSDMQEPEGKKGNNLPKPMKFKKEIQASKEKKREIEQKLTEQQEQEKLQKLKMQKKKKFARMLQKTNKRGQPSLKNTLLHLVDKLKTRGLGDKL